MTKTTTYINQGGQHTTPEGALVGKGQTFESADPDLCTKFPNKFALAGKDAPVNPAPAAGTPAAAEKPDNAATAAPTADVDVSGEFDLDTEGTLSVLKGKQGWAVYEEGDDEPLNEKPLKKKDVQAFVDDYLAD